MSMVMDGGLDALSINQLAKRIDFTPGALYRYFDSKEALLSVLTTEILDTLRTKLAAAAGLMEAGDGLGRVYAVCAAYRAFTRNAPHRFGMLSMMLAEPRTVFERAEVALTAMDAMMGALTPLADALSAAGLENSAQRATVLFAGIQGVFTLHKQARRAPHLFDIDALAEEMIQTLLEGWGISPRAIADAHSRVASIGPIQHLIGDWS
jgi:AcrR family transcriptional regulator